MVTFDPPLLCLVTDRRRCAGRPLEDVVAEAVDGGVSAVQLREKELPAARLFDLADHLRDITRGRALLFVNERVDIALAVGADGVQLAEEGLPLAAARRVAGTRLLLGRSVHSIDGAVAAQSEGADLLVVGTIFSTASHPSTVAHGIDILEQLSGRVQVPYLAIGGMTAQNIEAVMRSGASGAAVVSAITESDNPTLASRELVQKMRKAWRAAPRAEAVGPT